MRYYARTAITTDLHEVFKDLSDVSKSEYCADGASWWQAMKACCDLHSFYPADAIVQGGETIAVFGHNKSPESPKSRVTWFAGRPKFFTGAGPTLFARRFLRGLGVKWPGVVFNSYTKSRHPMVHRWFQALGYELKGYHDGYARYAFFPPAKAQVLGAA